MLCRTLVEESDRYLPQPVTVVDHGGLRAHADVRIFLLGSVLGALPNTRGTLVLHASVIQTDLGAILFMGRNGAGKSTLLGALVQRGYSMLADDKAVVVLDEARMPLARPGFPIVQLTKESATALRYPVHHGQLRANRLKYAIPVERFCATPIPLRAAYLLETHLRADIHLESLNRLDRFQMLNRHTYRRRFLHQQAQRRTHFRLLDATSRHVRGVRVARPEHSWLLEDLCDRLEEDMAR